MGENSDIKKQKWEEGLHNERLRLECLRFVLEHGLPNEVAIPWTFAQKHYLWVKYNNPNIPVK